MILEDMWSTGDPSVVVQGERSLVELSSVFPRTGLMAVARMSGVSLENDDNVFLQFYEAFQFPDYFGWNWDALSDCLRDLSWMPAERYIVIIDHAEETLAREANDRRTFFSILQRTVRDWNNPMANRRGVSVPFRVVLLCSDERVSELREELDAA